MRYSLQQKLNRQSLQQDRRKTIRAIPFFHEFRIALIGDSNVGKSNLAMKLVGKDSFAVEHEETIEDEYVHKLQFTFRLPAILEDGSSCDCYGHKQMAQDIETIPMELREHMKLDASLIAIRQAKEEQKQNSEATNNTLEKTRKKFSIFKKKKPSEKLSSSPNTTTELGCHFITNQL